MRLSLRAFLNRLRRGPRSTGRPGGDRPTPEEAARIDALLAHQAAAHRAMGEGHRPARAEAPLDP